MKASAKLNKRRTLKWSASEHPGNETARKAIGFLMLYMTAIVLNQGQSEGQGRTSAHFAAVFLTQFVAIFILNRGRFGLGTIYLLLAQIAPHLNQPAMVGTLFMLYVFLME